MKQVVIALLGMLAAMAEGQAAPPPAKQPVKKTYSAPAKPTPNRYYQPRYTRRWTPPPRPVGPLAPSPDRYREIQQALVERGYLAGEPTGEWKQDSIDGLKRFQQDQKLEVTGKLDALSIIALGLGPKRLPQASGAATTTSEAAKTQP